jgi:hypothetical protein
MASILEQYRVSDFLEWHQEHRLNLNPNFQRGSVWTPEARVYLIDTILRRMPIPKIYIRTIIDVKTKKSIREVVDGQQRLRAIIDFANDRLRLSKRAGEFSGLQYSTLDSELQETFLTYPIAVDQLVNADNDAVLETFARLNSYSVSLNDAEKRHAKFQGEFKWVVRSCSAKWSTLWEKYKIFSVRQRVRMQDDQLVAEMLGVLLEGVCDGGQPKINALYAKYDDKPSFNDIADKLNEILRFIQEEFADYLKDTSILSPPHFLMLFAAVAHALFGIPRGDMINTMPEQKPEVLSNIQTARDNLLKLAAILDSELPPDDYSAFWAASRSSTQRIASREVRFPVYYQALLPEPI